MQRFRCLLILFMVFGLSISSTTLADNAPNKCVQIYYDKVSQGDPKYYEGREYAAFLQNLLGHFPNIQQYVIPISSYQSGQLNRCDANFYISSYYDNKIPQNFLHDFATTKKNVVWMGYNIWKLGSQSLQKLWNVEYVDLGKFDWQHLDNLGEPGFFKFYDYKGEIFEKHGVIEPDTKKFDAAYDIVLLRMLSPESSKKYVVSWSRYSTGKQQKTPYILRNGNHWYIADVPFSFMHYDDRYLIFADALFDMVNEKPYYPNKKPAFVRLEDVNVGTTTPAQVRTMTDLFYKNHVPFSIALIPIFADPLGVVVKNSSGRHETILQSRTFLSALNYAKNKGASFIMHGVTHQYDSRKNPFNGVSGSDFEFWDVVNNTPIAEDSVPYVVNRLSEGVGIMEKAGLSLPVAWMPPHYNASPLDYILFGQLFTWNVGQVTYTPYEISDYKSLPEALTFDNTGVGNNASNTMRLSYLDKVAVNFPKKVARFTQFLPYEVYGDYFRQRLIPEDVGDIQPYHSEQVITVRSVDDMIKTIKRNRVLRDVWASFFVHGFLLNTPAQGGIARYSGDTTELERLLRETQAAGYEFIDLKSWVKQNHRAKAPPAIEIDPPDYQ